MSQLTDFTARLKSSLLDSVRAFNDQSYARHIQAALVALNEVRPQCKMAVVGLMTDRSLYPCPEDLTAVRACWWGRSKKTHGQPWDDDYPGRLPEWRPIKNTAGVRFLRAVPPPSATQMTVLGNECELDYYADHVFTDKECTLNTEELDLLLLRSQAEAMRELAIKNASTAYQLREGISSVPKNGTPAYLYTELMSEFARRAAR